MKSVVGIPTVASLQRKESAAIVSLTDSSGGTAGNTIVDVPAAYAEATLADQVASLAAKINGLLAACRTSNIIAT